MPPGTAASPRRRATGRTWIGSGRGRHSAHEGAVGFSPTAPSLCTFLVHYDSRDNGPYGVLPAQLFYRASFRRDSTAN